MTHIRAKQPRLRLDAEAYRQLCREVLKRDSWRCQSCGGIEGLHVHHIQYRSRLGDDAADGEIVCALSRLVLRVALKLKRCGLRCSQVFAQRYERPLVIVTILVLIGLVVAYHLR